MAIKELTTSEIDALVGTRHASTGFEYPSIGLQPYYEWLVRSLHLLGEAGAGHFKVQPDDAGDTTVAVNPGRADIAGATLGYGGGAVDLAAHNNDTALVWLFDDSGAAGIGFAAQGAGWPATTHIKLAEVTLVAGAITQTLDRRPESLFRAGLEPGAVEPVSLADEIADGLPDYVATITSQGDTATASTVVIEANDAQGQSIGLTDHLRVRVCDEGAYADATNATIAPGANTSVVETVTADKDLVLKSHTDGRFTIGLTNAVAETVTLRIGPAPFSGRRADYTTTLDVTHA